MLRDWGSWDSDPRYEFQAFYSPARQCGFILYPGKLTRLETFRVGCIGAIGPNEMEQAVQAVALALENMGIAPGEPAIWITAERKTTRWQPNSTPRSPRSANPAPTRSR
ncbi:MAG TPA: hypothetical protein VGA59_03060 [Ramlibacter sp.]|jgi:aspartate aminotransferase-like enzyme